MALSASQLADVRRFLGYDRGYDLHPRLESRFAPGALTAEEESRIGATLAAIGEIDDALQDAALHNLDAVKVDELVLRGPEQLRALRQQGRMHVARLSIFFAVDPLRDYFDEGGGASGGMFGVG